MKTGFSLFVPVLDDFSLPLNFLFEFDFFFLLFCCRLVGCILFWIYFLILFSFSFEIEYTLNLHIFVNRDFSTVLSLSHYQNLALRHGVENSSFSSLSSSSTTAHLSHELTILYKIREKFVNIPRMENQNAIEEKTHKKIKRNITMFPMYPWTEKGQSAASFNGNAIQNDVKPSLSFVKKPIQIN